MQYFLDAFSNNFLIGNSNGWDVKVHYIGKAFYRGLLRMDKWLNGENNKINNFEVGNQEKNKLPEPD